MSRTALYYLLPVVLGALMNLGSLTTGPQIRDHAPDSAGVPKPNCPVVAPDDGVLQPTGGFELTLYQVRAVVPCPGDEDVQATLQ